MGVLEVGTYGGKTGWLGWYGTRNWIAFVRKGQTLIYKRNPDTGAVIGEPLVC